MSREAGLPSGSYPAVRLGLCVPSFNCEGPLSSEKSGKSPEFINSNVSQEEYAIPVFCFRDLTKQVWPGVSQITFRGYRLRKGEPITEPSPCSSPCLCLVTILLSFRVQVEGEVEMSEDLISRGDF